MVSFLLDKSAVRVSFRVKSACHFLTDSRNKNKRADNAEEPGDRKGRLRRNFPKQPADCRRRCYRQTAQQIIEPNSARAQVWLGKIHDHCLTRGLANLF